MAASPKSDRLERLPRSTVAAAHTDFRKMETTRLRYEQYERWQADHKQNPGLRPNLDNLSVCRRLYPRLADAERASRYFNVPEQAFRRRERDKRAAIERERTETVAALDKGPTGDLLADCERAIREQQAKNRSNELRTRLLLELTAAARRGQPVAMVTLTVADQHYNNFREYGGHIWSRWIDHVHKRIRQHVHGNRKPRGLDCSWHAAVVENGAQGNRLHIHALIGASSFPEPTGRDPRRHSRDYRQELKPFLAWPLGFAQWLPIRMHEADAWATTHDHTWPVQDVGGMLQPKQTGTAEQVASYLAKYLQKQKQGALIEWRHVPQTPWKSRMSQTLGVHRISRALESSQNLLDLCLRHPPTTAKALKISAATTKRLLGREIARLLDNEALITAALRLPRSSSYWDAVKKVTTDSAYTLPSIGECDSLKAWIDSDNWWRDLANNLQTELIHELRHEFNQVDPSIMKDINT